ncbi:hypothetical protein EB001_12220 [bacterium]|nr:hypothetical protein [bacterium]
MKVKIGPYVKWWSPYRLAELIPFVSEDTHDKIGSWLSRTWIDDLCEWLNSKTKRKIEVRIDKYDTWNMDHTLALIILPMLKQLKATKQGSPLVDDEDLPPHMRHTLSKGPDDYETDDRWVHYKWDWVLNEMIWAFEKELDDSWEDQFRHGEPDYEFIHVGGEIGTDSELNEMIQKNPDYWVDTNKIKEYNNRIDNGFRLFGKYYRNLWD